MPQDFGRLADGFYCLRFPPAFVERAANEVHRLVDVEGLGQIFVRAALERGHRGIEIRIGGHHDDRHRGMTAYSDLDSAVAAFQGGAYEYLPKPFDIDQAGELIRRALDESRREAEAAEAPGETPEILGQAPAMPEGFPALRPPSQASPARRL